MELTRRQSLHLGLLALSAVLARMRPPEPGGPAPRATTSSWPAPRSPARPARDAPLPGRGRVGLGPGRRAVRRARRRPGNLAFSPYSVAVALAMTLNGARGGTAAEMRDVLHARDLGRFNGGLAALALTSTSRDQLARAERRSCSTPRTRCSGSGTTTWQRPFLDDLARYYGAGMRLVDYRVGDRGRRAASSTRGRRGRPTTRSPRSSRPASSTLLTRLVLVNAVYLQGAVAVAVRATGPPGGGRSSPTPAARWTPPR